MVTNEELTNIFDKEITIDPNKGYYQDDEFIEDRMISNNHYGECANFALTGKQFYLNNETSENYKKQIELELKKLESNYQEQTKINQNNPRKLNEIKKQFQQNYLFKLEEMDNYNK
jgi:hypothetical protein